MIEVNNSLFIEEIREQLDQLVGEFSYDSHNHAFVHWIVQTILEIDAQDSFEAAEVSLVEPNSIDAFVSEVNDDHITRIFNVRYTEDNPYEKSFGVEVIDAAIESINLLRTASIQEIENLTLRRKATEYRNRKKLNYECNWIIVVFGNYTEEARNKLDEMKQELRESGIGIIAYDITDIKEMYAAFRSKQSLDRVEDAVEFSIMHDQCFERLLVPSDENGTKALIIALSATEIVELYKKFKFELFDLNVRYSLGSTDASRAMRDTLCNPEGRQLFFAYNNGMTILCDDFHLIEESNSILLTAPQIVNGCQTTITLYKNREYLDENVAILARIINSKTDELSQHIAESTNTQNAVTYRDLRANDAIQKKIQLKFEALIPQYKYERKRGEWRKLTPQQKTVYSYQTERGGTSHRRIDSQTAAQCYLAFSGKPIEARTKKRKLFIIRGGYYNEIFDDDRSAEEYLLPVLLFDYINSKKLEFTREYRSAMKDQSLLSDTITQNWQARSVLLYASYTILGLMGHLVRKRYQLDGIQDGYNKDVASWLLSDFSTVVEQLYRICAKEVQRYTHTYISAKADYDISNAHKQTKTFDNIIGSLEIELDADPSIMNFLQDITEAH